MPSVRNDIDNDMSGRLARLEYAFQSKGGQAMLKVAMLIIGVLLTALLSTISYQLKGIGKEGSTNTLTNAKQDLALVQTESDMRYMRRRLDALETVKNASLITLQNISERVAVNTNKLDAIVVRRSRPAK